VKVYDGLFAALEKVSHRMTGNRHGWVQVIKGAVTVNRTLLQVGDGAAISEETLLDIEATGESEILLFDLL
jgi:redox-sensitive bicupin YhaK (pirin superfamily)